MNYFVQRQDTEYGRCDGIIHEIKSGDSLYKVSRLYGITLDDLLEKNPNVDVYNLRISERLCIPVKHIPYIIKQGDTLDRVLEQFDLNYEDFRRANPQMTPFMMEENTVVYIPENRG